MKRSGNKASKVSPTASPKALSPKKVTFDAIEEQENQDMAFEDI